MGGGCKIDQHQQGKQLLPFFLSSPFLNSTPGLVPGSGANTWKRKANAKDRKRIERTRSQKLGEKKGAYAPLIFELDQSVNSSVSVSNAINFY